MCNKQPGPVTRTNGSKLTRDWTITRL